MIRYMQARLATMKALSPSARARVRQTRRLAASVRGAKDTLLRDDGQEIIEFGMTALYFFGVVFAFFYICIVLWRMNLAAHAAREAARWASVRGTACTTTTIPDGTCPVTTSTQVTTFVNSIAGAGNMSATINWCLPANAATCSLPANRLAAGTGNKQGNIVQISVTYPVMNIPWFTKPQFSISSTAEQVMLQ
jgi:Flp pilus assembly protein TadG